MAFRATRKLSTTKTTPLAQGKSEDSSGAQPGGEVSVEDLVGGPKLEKPALRQDSGPATQEVQKDTSEPSSSRPVAPSSPTRSGYHSRPRSFEFRRPQSDFVS